MPAWKVMKWITFAVAFVLTVCLVIGGIWVYPDILGQAATSNNDFVFAFFFRSIYGDSVSKLARRKSGAENTKKGEDLTFKQPPQNFTSRTDRQLFSKIHLTNFLVGCHFVVDETHDFLRRHSCAFFKNYVGFGDFACPHVWFADDRA